MSTKRKNQKGFSTIVVMLLIALLAVFAASNSMILSGFKRSLNQIEQRQLKKFDVKTSPVQREQKTSPNPPAKRVKSPKGE
jgi:hypothetical protein